MNDADLAFASIKEIGKLFRKRKLSPVELTKLMLARIEKLNPKLNAYLTVTAELALAQTRKAERQLFASVAAEGSVTAVRSTAFPSPSRTTSTRKAFERR